MAEDHGSSVDPDYGSSVDSVDPDYGSSVDSVDPVCGSRVDMDPNLEEWDVSNDKLPSNTHNVAIQKLLQTNRKVLHDYRVRESEVEELTESFPQSVQTESCSNTRWNKKKSDEGRPFTYVQSDPKKLYITNISYKTGQRKLWDFFAKLGQVKHCQLLRTHNGKSKGRGFVTFIDVGTAHRVLLLDEEQMDLDQRTLHVEPATYKKYIDIMDAENRAYEIENKDNVDQGSSDVESYNACEELLPDDILLGIFRYLTIRELLVCQRVCKRWLYISRRHLQVIKYLSFDFFKTRFFQGISCRHLRYLLKRCKMLESVDISMLSNCVGNDALAAIADHCVQLLHLDISQLPISNTGLFTLADRCKLLRSISINYCGNINEKGLWKLFRECQDLRVVNVQGNLHITGKCFHVLGEKVEKLSVGGCSKLCNVALEKLSSKCSHLRELNLTDCNSITADGITFLSQFTSLQVLNLSGVNISLMELALENLPDLRQLYLEENKALTASFLSLLGLHCPQLRELDISDTNVHLSSIHGLGKCRHLHTLIADRISAHGVGVGVIGDYSSLVKLNLVKCLDLTDDDIHFIVSKAGKLRDLEISYTDLTNSTLEVVAMVMRAEPQRSLTLYADGTDIEPESVDLPSNLVCLNTITRFRMPDIIYMDEASDDEYYLDMIDSDVDEAIHYLDGDDPFFEELFDMS